MKIKIEICTEGVDSAVAAQAGGADRVELCANLMQGGTTPSIGMIEMVREKIDLDLMVIVRPRGGDFLYTDLEYEVMAQDIVRLHGLGVDGVVIGLLNADGSIDRERTARLIESARPMQITFHRAFDMSRDPFESLDTLLELGVDRILTSGQAPNAMDGVKLIGQLNAAAGGKAIILPAGGINRTNGPLLVNQAGVRELHIGGGVKAPFHSGMTVRNRSVFMGIKDDELSEFEWPQVSADKVRELVEAVAE